MFWYALVVAWCCLVQAQASPDSPRIIIVGAGASGIAAASRLMQNGFNNITILEAENRIGGRVYTREFGGYMVDVGGQWVHGEEDNAAYELAWPLGVLEHSHGMYPAKFFSSSGPAISEDTGKSLMELHANITGSDPPDEYLNKSTGDYYQQRYDEYFDAHPEITKEQRESLINMFNLFDMASNAADSWHNISVNREEEECKGDFMINWKNRGYTTILDILMEKFPDPTQELPVMNSTILNTEVSQINYNLTDGPVRVITANGDEFTADHVIVTTSIGVLKADYKTMFNPSLPEVKINAIERAQIGSVAKIILVYDAPWWGESGNPDNLFNFYWTDEDRNKLANDPEKSWILGIGMAFNIQHKPNLLLCWVTGPSARQMESIPEELVFSQVKEFLHRFLGKAYNLTEPTAMLRSQWFTNKHFRGTWSYRTPEFQRSDSKVTDLSEPITEAGKPVVLFAGEVTHPIHPGTVHGAIATGWREADRLIKFYLDEKRDTGKTEYE